MHRLTIAVTVVLLAGTGPLSAQDTARVADSGVARPDTGPTPAQKRYQDGLRLATRGLSQLRDGVDRVLRTKSSADTTRRRQAGLRLSGLCGTAYGFLTRGRAQMSSLAYEDSVQVIARQLVSQIDSIARLLPPCQKEAGGAGERVATDLDKRLKSYDVALQRYRVAIAPPPPVAATPVADSVPPE